MEIRVVAFRRRIAVVVGAVVLLAGTGGAAALALAGHDFGSSTDSGNEQPIDDNHPAASPTPAGEHGSGG